jgi:3-oxoacyl-[acyl-carrier-protein] synthase-3
MAGRRAGELDFILYATWTPDTLLPSAACWLQKRLGAQRAWALDVNAACSGFVYALSLADNTLRAGQAQTGLVIGSDVLSAFTNWEERSTCVLFGDASGAAVVERVPGDSERRILSTHLHADGRLWDLFHVPAGGSGLEVTPERIAEGAHKMHMKGREIFKIAVQKLGDLAVLALERNGLGVDDLDWFVPHQANIRIIEGAAKRIGLPMERVVVNIERYGNTSAATVPTAFDEAVRDGRVQSGDLVLFDAFGAGLTHGSALLRW